VQVALLLVTAADEESARVVVDKDTLIKVSGYFERAYKNYQHGGTVSKSKTLRPPSLTGDGCPADSRPGPWSYLDRIRHHRVQADGHRAEALRTRDGIYAHRTGRFRSRL
jgi:hypothetical protein